MGFDIMSDLDNLSSIADVVKGRIGKGQDKNKKLEQFEKCSVKNCKFYNVGGECCSFETCRLLIDDPLSSTMITKTCQICGNEFSTNITTMPIQMCPACREAALKARGHPHECLFCGKEIDDNPAIFFACCDECFTKLRIIATGSVGSLELSCNIAHCYECPWE